MNSLRSAKIFSRKLNSFGILGVRVWNKDSQTALARLRSSIGV